MAILAVTGAATTPRDRGKLPVLRRQSSLPGWGVLAADDSYTFDRDQAQLARAAGLHALFSIL